MNMSRQSIKLLFVVVLIALGVCYGLEMASSGMEQVNGPIVQQDKALAVQEVEATTVIPRQETATVITPAPATQAVQPVKKSPQAVQPASSSVSPEEGLAATNRIASKTGDLLQIVSHHGIDMVINLFDKILD